MALMDVFRPKWKHSDPDVRMAAVKGMTDQDEGVLELIAQNDPDGSVREAALERLSPELRNLIADAQAHREPDPSEKLRAVCASCGKRLPRDADRDGSAIEASLLAASGGLYLGTVCGQCGKVECYSCRGGVGLPCSGCGGHVSPAYAKLFT